MDEPDLDADALFCDAVCTLVLAALEGLGDDQEARFALFKKLLAAAQDVCSGLAAEGRVGDGRQPGDH